MSTPQPSQTTASNPTHPSKWIETTPTIKPVLIWFGLTVLAALIVLPYILANPELFGDPQLTEIVFWVVLLLFTIALLRLGIRMYILTRTRYIVTPDGIRREYSLVYRQHARELPIEKIRGIEFNQTRIQHFLGYGTLSFLAGGTNQSLGFVEFEHIEEPDILRVHIRELVNYVSSGQPSLAEVREPPATQSSSSP